MQPHEPTVDPQPPLVVRLRSCWLGVPEAAVVEAWGRPTFRAGKKIFTFAGASMADPLTFVFKPTSEERLAYLERPAFYSPPYWGPGGWLAAPLGSPDVTWDEVCEIVDTSYRLVALKRQIAALDAR